MCIRDSANTDLYQSPLLEEPNLANTQEARRQQILMTRKAENLCLDCPMMVDCLYQAVVKHDVAGYAAQIVVVKNRLGPAGRRADIAITFNGTVHAEGLT